MNGFLDKRQYLRIPSFWRVYRDDKEWGYLVNLSKGGIKIWVNDYEIPSNFNLGFPHPEQSTSSLIYFNVNKIWTRIGDNNQFNEIGCRFTRLNQELEEYLTELIHFFNQRTMAIFINNVNRDINHSVQV